MTRHGFASRGKSHRQKQEEEVQRALLALAKSCDSSILPWFMLAPAALSLCAGCHSTSGPEGLLTFLLQCR